MNELNRQSIPEFKKSEKLPIVVVLDNIRSLANIGSVFRTADGFSIEKVILCGITAQPPHREIQKTALGATESVNWEYYDSTLDALCELKKFGYTVAGVEQVSESTFLNQFDYTGNKLAIVFGNEVKGVDQKVLNQCDSFIEIPQTGTKHSFNISVSVGIVLWELVRS